MTTTTERAALTLATTVPETRMVNGLEYGSRVECPHGPAYYVRPAGFRTWGIAYTIPDGYLQAADALKVVEMVQELDRWEGLPRELLPAAALIVERGGIVATVDAEELREAVGSKEWPALSAHLESLGYSASGTLWGSTVLAALDSISQAITPDSQPLAQERASSADEAGPEERGSDDENALYHAVLKLEALGASCQELTDKLQGEVQDNGGTPKDLDSLGHLIMLTGLIRNIASAVTDP